MRRREFIAGLGGAAWPVAARAQAGRTWRIGALISVGADDRESRAGVAAFEQRLQELG